jgi:hypothetical protein
LPDPAADVRHVFIIHEILKSWPFKSALEIGSFLGATATAFIEAIGSGEGLGAGGGATFCDVSVSDSLLDVVRSCKQPKTWQVTPQPSWAVLDSEIPFDFIFVDGAHDVDTVGLELKRLMRRRPLCVMAHDTNATDAGYSKCEGAKLLRDTFAADPGYRILEDVAKRPGERTERGLFFATTDADLHRVARGVFEKWA